MCQILFFCPKPCSGGFQQPFEGSGLPPPPLAQEEFPQNEFLAICVNAAGVPGGPDPQIFDLQRSINVLDPTIIPTQSRVRCTIFVNIIDRVVGAVVEQVHSSTFKFCLLKIQEICPLKRFVLTSKCTKMRRGAYIFTALTIPQLD